MNSLRQLAQTPLFGNSLLDWGLAIAAFLITFTVLPLLKSYLLRLAKRPGHASAFRSVQLLLRLIPRTSRLFMWVVAINFAERFLDFSSRVEHVLHVLILVGLWFQVGIWAMTAVEYVLERKQQQRGAGDTAFASSLGIINFLASAVIWSLVALLALDNLGINITALVAGLGIGGVAIALAVQTVLGDLLASLSIALDKPFAAGDSLSVDNINGTVEQIGVRSTRLRSVDGEQIILSNADLLKSRVRNYGRMGERRGMVKLGVNYRTGLDKVRRVNGIIEAAIKAQKNVRLERCYFKEIGATAFNFEATYFVVDGNYNTLVAAQQDVNFRILEAFEKEKIEFAYPTQTLEMVTAEASER
jgi:small-conductance mechanosensitive channel